MARRWVKKRSGKIGLPPGTMVHVGEKKVDKVRMTLYDYDKSHFQFRVLESIEEAFPYRDTPTVTWINIEGLHDVSILEKMGAHFDIHPLILEDVLNTEQRPKMEVSDSLIFLVLKMLSYEDKSQGLNIEHLGLILGKNFVITCQERMGDIFDPVRHRIESGSGRLRENKSDYLAYALLDLVVDDYFLILEKLGESIEEIEEQVVTNPDAGLIYNMQHLKRVLLFLRKFIWPLREVIGELLRDEPGLIQKSTIPFLRDLYDHTIQVIDTIEIYRDMVSSVLDIYLSSVSNRMNQIMKVLTIIGTIFIPLTFLAGIYGMNFEYMPELKWRWSYPLFWGVVVVIFTGLVYFFRKRKWL